jgi:putative CocE/NonD family hydrolase
MDNAMSEQISVEFDVPATMRDGVVLRANIFRPAGAGPYPVALTRTPYSKDFASVMPFLDALRLARSGYIVVIQDVRGRFRSEGQWRPFHHEDVDGYDTVEWAARLPGASGAVGMYGLSYLGFTQWMAAKEAPPSLKAIVPALTWADIRDGVFWRGGAFELGTYAGWHLSSVGLDTFFKRYESAPPQEQAQALMRLVGAIDRLRTEGYRSLPLKDFAPLKELELANVDEVVENAENQGYYAPFSIATLRDQVQVPSLNVGGWYDIFTQGSLQNYCAQRAAGSTPEARQSKLLIGPWSHVNYTSAVGDVDFGLASTLAFMNLQTDMTGLTQRWFDYWLKGIENGVTEEPPIKLFVMGDNIWRDEQEWPLARARSTPFYLRSAGQLAPEPPDAEPPDHYIYDPADPTPTFGGSLLIHPLFGVGAKDQRALEARADVVSYTTEPLAQDTEVTGPLLVRLWATSDATDTDFVAQLVDVYPDGFAPIIADGIIRARYRNGAQPELLEPGQPYEYTIDLWATANVFKAGHRIRVDIASASFPRWNRNPNTGATFGDDSELRPARQTILHDAEHPSHIVLPIVPR